MIEAPHDIQNCVEVVGLRWLPMLLTLASQSDSLDQGVP